MANYCSQDLYVYGPASVIAEFVEFSKQGESLLSADRYVPYPQKFKDLDGEAIVAHQCGMYWWKDGFASGGEEWCVENWGTARGIYDCNQTKFKLNGSRSQVNYTFGSDWLPAKKIIHAMSEKFPALRFKLNYYEAGMCFKGVYKVANGKVYTDTQTEYHGRRGETWKLKTYKYPTGEEIAMVTF